MKKSELLGYVLILAIIFSTKVGAEIIYSGPNQDVTYAEYTYNDPVSIAEDEGTWDDLHLSLHIFVDPPRETVIYSGPNQDVTYAEYTHNDPISIAGEGDSWDDLHLDLHIFDDPTMGLDVDCMTMRQIHGNYVQSAYSGGDAVRLDEGNVINSSRSYDIDYNTLFSCMNGSTSGQFYNQSGYMALKLIDGSDTYYGWAYVSSENCNSTDATLIVHEWACSSERDEPINAGQISDIEGGITEINAYTMLEVHGNHVESAKFGGSAVRLNEGDTIDSSRIYDIGYNELFGYMNGSTSGQFYNQSGYMALKLIDGSDTYYGWARVSTENCGNTDATVTIHEWAYNNTPDETIQAGELPEQASITTLTQGMGSISPSNPTNIFAGSIINFLVEAQNADYHISTINLNDTTIYANSSNRGLQSTNIFQTITSNGTMTAVFASSSTISGIPLTWLTQYNISNKNDSIEEQQLDGDGFSVLQEYISDTDPTNGASCFPPLTMTRTNNNVIFCIDPTSTARVYYLDMSTNLLQTGWLLVTNTTGSGDSLTFEEPLTEEGAMFFRSSVTLP